MVGEALGGDYDNLVLLGSMLTGYKIMSFI